MDADSVGSETSAYIQDSTAIAHCIRRPPNGWFSSTDCPLCSKHANFVQAQSEDG